MTLPLFDISPIRLTFTVGPPVDLRHGTSSLTTNGNSLFAELRALTSTEVILDDIRHDGVLHRLYAWDLRADGASTPWTRDASGSRSGPRNDMNSEVLVIAVPPDHPVPDPQSGPPAPGTSTTVVKVKIRRQGGMPL